MSVGSGTSPALPLDTEAQSAASEKPSLRPVTGGPQTADCTLPQMLDSGGELGAQTWPAHRLT